MNEESTSYRQIMKATSLFGGVQVFNIIVSIVRSKFIAILLGTAGMGILGLFTLTIGLISSFTNFGLGTSAVKDIAAADKSEDSNRITLVVTIFRRLVWITGTLGTFITLILSPWLSQLTFGTKDYTIAFIWISITLLFLQLNSGQLVILQGTRKLKHLAKANIVGSALGLFVTLPLYYYWSIDGIVPGIIGTSLISLLVSWYFSRKIILEKKVISRIQIINESKSMLRMGFMISLSGLLSVGASYIVSIFIGRTNGIEQVGLYNAGFAIINTYVGLIFNAMGTDYYPRLSSVANDNKLSKKAINQQAEIALLILAPILIIFLVFINWIVLILYSKQFLAVKDMIYWAALGMFFKAATWAMGFLFLAKGESKLFFWSELASNIVALMLNILGYWLWGLSGLGISFLVIYFISFWQVYIINKLKFEFKFESSFLYIFIFQFGLAIISFLAIKYLSHPYNYCVGVVLVVLSGWYSIKELENRLGFFNQIKYILKK